MPRIPHTVGDLVLEDESEGDKSQVNDIELPSGDESEYSPGTCSEQ
jgi:hypothetical protein